MHPQEEVNAKLQAEKAYYGETPSRSRLNGDTCGATTQGVVGRGPTLRAQAEINVGYHREQAEKYDRAAAFFRENPAFDEFIQLVRIGAIQL